MGLFKEALTYVSGSGEAGGGRGDQTRARGAVGQGFRRSVPAASGRRTGEAGFPRQIDNSLAFHALSVEFRPGSLPTHTTLAAKLPDCYSGLSMELPPRPFKHPK